MIAIIGDKSSGPTRGMYCRIGARIGSVISFRITAIGLPGSIPIKETITRRKIATERMMERMKMNVAAASIGLSS
jgi:hypothetical protein